MCSRLPVSETALSPPHTTSDTVVSHPGLSGVSGVWEVGSANINSWHSNGKRLVRSQAIQSAQVLLLQETKLRSPEAIRTASDWMQSQGVPEGSSTRYVTALFQALTAMSARVDPSELANLREECQTEGGLNEQVYQGCVAAGWSPILTGELEKILERLRKNVLTTEKL